MEEKKRLLIYAHYYAPDVASTGQILKELAEGLNKQFEVTVICVVPSYSGTIEAKYKKKKYYREEMNGVCLLRVSVPEFSKENKISRIVNLITYFLRALWATFKVGKQDYVLAVSQPPIFGGILGVWGKWVKKCKYIYQIQDFNPEQILAVDYFKFKPLLWVLMKLDKFSCSRADKVITVGRDLVETLMHRFKDSPSKMPAVALINNWIDEQEIYPLNSNEEHLLSLKFKYGLNNKFVIMYSGNLGHYYDLLNLLKVIEKFKPGTRTTHSRQYPMGQEIVFVFAGGGSMLETLKSYCKFRNLSNVIFIPYQNKEDLNYSLNIGDVHWCVNAKGIKGVSCPSKYYGLAACAKPILAVLEKGSEIRSLIEETEGGRCCEPEDYIEIEKSIRWFIENAGSDEVIQMGKRGREYLLKNLTKEISIKKYIEEILNA